MIIEVEAPRLIVGLGNPGLKYRHTRHNFGFMTVEALAESLALPLKRLKFSAMTAEGRYLGKRLVLAKPLTYMNESGKSVSQLIRFYKIPLEQVMVIHDDLDLPLGTLRIRPSGGTAGQKGMASITNRVGSQDFPRMRLGIGRPPGQMDPADYVLMNFLPSEMELKKIVLNQAVEAVKQFVVQGLEVAMNKYNGDVG